MKKWLSSRRSLAGLLFCILALGPATKEGQTSQSSQLDKARTFFKEGNLSAAEEEVRRVLKSSPDSSRASVLLTRILLIKDDLDQASKQIHKALIQTPQDPSVLTAYGLVLLREGELTN